MAKQTIAIIGATGDMGSALAKSLARGPYRVLLFAKDAEKLAVLAEEIIRTRPGAEVEAIGCPVDASWEADIIIAAVPYQGQEEVADKIRQVATGKVVISMTNPLNETNSGVVTPPYTSAAEELQQLLPHSKVVKAFNTVRAADFSSPSGDAYIAGNDEEAVETVTALVHTTGFNPMVVGELSVSRTLESLSFPADPEALPPAGRLIQSTIKSFV